MSDKDKFYVEREQLSEAQLEEALKHCASEPIHIPSAIQPHGFLIVSCKTSHEITQVSENIQQHLAKRPIEFLGKTLFEILPKEVIEQLPQKEADQSTNSYSLQNVDFDSKPYELSAHCSDTLHVLEFEPKVLSSDDALWNVTFESLRAFSLALDKAQNESELFDLITEKVRLITGFDRVKLYRFDSSWNGHVIAESRAEHMPSYLGLHFPASDIPEQARRLYSLNYLRLIADVRYKPSPLFPPLNSITRQPLDMTQSVLRSVSPVHVQYLENINVRASMSISVMQNGRLWGLVACHHASTKFLPQGLRVLCEILGNMFSAKLTSVREELERERRAARKILLNRLALGSGSVEGTEKLIVKSHSVAMEAMKADGLAIVGPEGVETFGHCPSLEVIDALSNWFAERQDRSIVHTADVGDFFKTHPIINTVGGGILIAPIGQFSRNSAMWFRKSKVEQVIWAGNPEKPAEETKAGYRLTPRSSFELWKTSIKGRSDAWLMSDVETAESITNIILESEKIRAEFANSAKTQFLSQMSHELRTPLGAIISIIQLLSRDENLNMGQARLITTLEESADSLLALIDDLLDLNRIEANEMMLEFDDFELAGTLEDIRSVMAVKASEKGIDLRLNYEQAKKLVFHGDRKRLKQVLYNLVGNAIKFTERGTVTVYASVSSENETNMRMLQIEVIDTGIGIPRSKAEAIFEKFIQADNTISRRFGGSGLGLSICKQLIELMDGEIRLESHPGLGSNFTIRIPLKAGEREPASENKDFSDQLAELRPLAPSDDRRIKILLAEDYEGNIIALLNFLQGKNYEVSVARDGQLAVEYYENRSFDIIIMDVQMPSMDGLTATRTIRNLEKERGIHPRTPILGMTANAMKEDKERCFAAGMDDYISKPLRLEVLLEKIRMLTKTH